MFPGLNYQMELVGIMYEFTAQTGTITDTQLVGMEQLTDIDELPVCWPSSEL